LLACISNLTPYTYCRTPGPDLPDESNNIPDVGFGEREKDELNEMTTLLKEMVGLLRDMNQRQASLGMQSSVI
jgi:hypothetical protein